MGKSNSLIFAQPWPCWKKLARRILTDMTTLYEAYRQAKKNGGASGIDGQSFADVEQAGVREFLESIRAELQAGTYQPQPNRKVDIPKANGKMRTLQIPSIRDRVVQGALKLMLEAIFRGRFLSKLVRISTQTLPAPGTGECPAQYTAPDDDRD